MPIQVIETRRLYQQIADQLRQLIEKGEYPVGSRLPTERDLARMLGVSRPSVREALIALEVEGRVEVRMGSGVYVTEPPRGRRANPVGALGEGSLEIMSARALVEGEIAAQAATRAKRRDLREIAAALDMMVREAGQSRVPIDGDRRFHVRIAETSGNSVLARIVGELFDERHSPLSAQFGRHFETAQTWQAAIDEHRAILAALQARDPDAARAAMQGHLQQSHARWSARLTGMPKKTAKD